MKDDPASNITLEPPSAGVHDTVVIVEGTKRVLCITATDGTDIFKSRLFVDTDYERMNSRGLYCDAVKVEDNGSVRFLIACRDAVETLGTASVGHVNAVYIMKEDDDGDIVGIKLVKKDSE